MKEVKRLTLDRPATYQIQVPGELDPSWSDWAGGMTIAVAREGDDLPVTTLTGIVDQAALQGLLRRLYSLGLPLLSVRYEEEPLFPVEVPNVYLPGKENGRWDYYGYSQRTLDRDRFDEFKTRFYELQGWDTATGYPTRAALESQGLGYVTDELEVNGKLGAGHSPVAL